MKEKTCFVIAPIGEEKTSIRKRSDQVLIHIITPAVTTCGYSAPIRSDKISNPGMITTQVIQQIIEADLVIADLSYHNPNVFYELSLRHALKKPVVQIIKEGDKIPFDVTTQRTIQFNHEDLDSSKDCEKELIRQIRSVEKDPSCVDSPISMSIEMKALKASGDLIARSNAEMINNIRELRREIAEMEQKLSLYIKPSGDSPFPMYVDTNKFVTAANSSFYPGLIPSDSVEMGTASIMDKLTENSSKIDKLLKSMPGLKKTNGDFQKK